MTAPLTPAQRSDLLDDEFLRVTPGLRPFSVAILRLCRQLGLALGTGAKGSDPAREILTVAWLLDLRNPREMICAMAAAPALLAPVLDEYEFALAPAFLLAVKAEIDRAEAAVSQTLVKVASKPVAPGGSAPPSPPGNS